MNKLTLRKTTDLALYALFCFLLGTGLLIHFRLVPGSRGGHGLAFLGLGRHDWGEWHLWGTFVFLGLLLLHLTLNFAFIRNAIAKKLTGRMIGLLGLGIAIVGFFLVIPISQREGRGQGWEEDHASVQSTGSSSQTAATIAETPVAMADRASGR